MNTKILVLSGDVPLINNELLLEFSNYNNALVVSEADDPTGYGRVFINTNGIPSIQEHKFCKKNMLFYSIYNKASLLSLLFILLFLIIAYYFLLFLIISYYFLLIPINSP